MNLLKFGFGIAATCLPLACASAPSAAPAPARNRLTASNPGNAQRAKPLPDVQSRLDPAHREQSVRDVPNRAGDADGSSVTGRGTVQLGGDAAVGSNTADRVNASRAGATPAFDASVFLSTLAIGHDQSLQRNQLRLLIRLPDGPLGELTRRGRAGDVHNQRITVDIPDTYPVSNDAVRPMDRACSYLIDCDVEPMRSLGVNELSLNPSIAELVSFAQRHITKKSLSRGFDVASDVALHREGDCTEHAVLLAALLRRHHHAARVVLGFVVLRRRQLLPLVVGHAWTETHDGHGWQVADAALNRSGIAQLSSAGAPSYLPLQVVTEESAAFQVSLLSGPGTWLVERAESSLFEPVP